MRSVGGWIRAAVFLVLVVLGGHTPLMAQGLNNVVRPTANANPSVFTPPPGLPASYQVQLASAWDRPDIIQVCRLEGGETISGRVTWTGTNYVGLLRRQTNVIECGVHATDSCTVQVTGSGEVQAAGEPTAFDDGRPGLMLRWSPARETRVVAEGTCAEAYRDALARMYRTTSHMVLIPVPRVGHDPVAEMLDDQPWSVKVSP